MWYHRARQRLYVSGGEGAISVIGRQGSDSYEMIAKIPTAPGARTSFFIPEPARLYLAVPHRGSQRAEIRIYNTQ